MGEKSVSGRSNSGAPKNDGTNTKPDPLPGKIVEKVQALQLQYPTMTESEFLNNMEIEFGDADRAVYSFKYAPDDNGSLFFTLAQVRFNLIGCTQDVNRSATIKVFWQEIEKGQRKIVSSLKGSIQEFEFRGGYEYMLSYVLMDLKKDFADCKSANLKFAAFAKNYK